MSESDSISQDDHKLVRKFSRSVSREAEHCLSFMDLAAYMDGKTDAAECERIEAHLASCPSCLQALVEARKLLAEPSMLAHKRILDRAKSLVPSRAAPARESRAASPRVPWKAVARWAAAVAASVLVGLAGLSAGSSLCQSRIQSDERLVTEITFELVPPDQTHLALDEDPFKTLFLREQEGRP